MALVGTTKGLFLLSGDDDRHQWRTEGPLLDGWGIYHAMVDPRDGTLYAATNHRVYGPTVQRSADRGRTWRRSRKIGLPEESGLTLEAVWHIEPGRPEDPNRLYLGAAPGALFRSDDGGDTWEANGSILEHPTRKRWFPGAGGMCCHSIQLDRQNARRMYVGITAAGVFRSDDDGETWIPVNRNVMAEFLGDPYSEVGQCPHKLLLHPLRHRLWQQNHYGVYLSDDRGDTWQRVDGNGLPSGFGFPIMIDPTDPEKAFVIPEKSLEYHHSSGGQLAVYRTRDSGESWELMADGLPKQAWAAVLREGSASDAGVAVFRHSERFIFRIDRGRGLGRGDAPSSADPVRRGHRMAQVVVPSMLAAQAEGRQRFDVEADTIGGALRALPVADLLFNERGELNRHLNVYVDGTDVREHGGLTCPLADAREIRVVAMVSGG